MSMQLTEARMGTEFINLHIWWAYGNGQGLKEVVIGMRVAKHIY